MWWL